MGMEKWILDGYGRNLDPQNFSSNPLAIRDSNHYVYEYTKGVAENWDQLIDWRSRFENETKFFLQILRNRKRTKILDVATGTGFDSIHLIEAGFDVTSLDGSASMLKEAQRNAKKRKCNLKIIHSDWRSAYKETTEKFDAIICLGNSFSHLFTIEDQIKSLKVFNSLLRDDGILIFDHLNFHKINFNDSNFKHKFYYSSKKAYTQLEYLDDNLARLCYKFPFFFTFYLNLFPINMNYARDLLMENGFNRVKTFYDFSDTISNDPEFFIHIGDKN